MVIRFGPFRLEPSERRLYREDELLDLQDKVIEVLLVLTERPGRLWTREQLHKRLWPDTLVSEDALFQALAKTRKALGDPVRDAVYIATVPGQGYRFVAPVECDEEAPAATPPRPPGERLTAPVTSLVGRDAERSRLLAELGEAPGLWTFTGPGGMGKTRLALELGARYEGGAAFCDLQTATTEGEVWAAVGLALRLNALAPDDPAAVCAAVGSRGTFLLVLDNGEQVIGPLARVVHRLLEAAPHARLLVTSRIRLGLVSERLVELTPLAQPTGCADLAELEGSPAASLLLDRARTMVGWRPTPDQAADITALSAALGGLPLAIELAAPRLRLLSPGQLLARMDRQLDLLAAQTPDRPARHHSLRSAIATSWDLLEPPLRDALARLSVFEGPFSAEVAERALDGEGVDPLLALAELIDHSLVRRRDDRPDRPLLQLLPSIRSFARSHLGDAARAAMLDRIGHAYADLAAFPGPEHLAAWQAGMERESLVLALAHATAAGEASIATAIATTLCRTLLTRGPLHEVGRRLAPLLRLPGLRSAERTQLLLLEAEARLFSTEVEAAGVLLEEAEALHSAGSPLSARLARLRGTWHYRRGAIPDALAAVDRGLSLPSLAGDERARLLLLRGQVQMYAVQSVAARDTLEEARALVDALDLRPLRAELLLQLGLAQLTFFGLHEGRRILEQSIATAREDDNPVAAARAESMLGRALLHLGQREEAARALDRAEPVLRQAGLVYELGTLLESRAHLALYAGRLEECRHLLRQAIALMEAAGQARGVTDPMATLATVHIRLGELDDAEGLLLAVLDRFAVQARNPGMVLHNLAEIDIRRGRYDAGRARLRAALDALLAGGKPVSAALTCMTLGELELAAKDPRAAVAPLREAIERLRTRDRHDLLAQGLGCLGLALGLTGCPAESDAAFSEALEILASAQYAELRALVLLKQARVALHERRPEDARALRDRAVQAMGDREVPEVRAELAEIERALG